MERQTNDNPQTNMETLLNYAYDKDENVHLRYADGKYDVALHEFIAKNCPAEAMISIRICPQRIGMVSMLY